MAAWDKGINIKIGADTTGLDKAMAGVNKDLRETQTELKQVERLLKFDPKNTTLLAQKQELLAKSVKLTTQKLKQLKDVQDQVGASAARGDIGAGQYRRFQREIAQTETQLKKLQTTGGKAANSLKTAWGRLKDSWAPITAGVVAFGAAAVMSVKAYIEAEKSQVRLEAAVRATGAAYADYEMQITNVTNAAMRMAFDDEAAADALAKLVAATGDVTEATKQMALVQDLARLKDGDLVAAAQAVGKALNGNYKSLITYVPAAKNAKDSTEALAIAQKAAAGQAEAFARTTQGSLERTTVAYENLKETVGEELAPALEDAANGLSDLAQSFGEQSQGAKDAEIKVGGLAAALALVAKTAAVFAGGWKALWAGLMSPVAAAVGGFGTIALLVGKGFKTMWDDMVGGVKGQMFRAQMSGNEEAVRKLRDEFDLAIAIENGWITQQGELTQAAKDAGWGQENLAAALKGTSLEYTLTGDAAAGAKGSVEGLSGSMGDSATAAGEAAGEIDKLARAVDGLMVAEDDADAITRSLTEAQLDYSDAVISAKEADAEVAKLRKEGKTGTDEYRTAVNNAARAHLRLNDATADWATETLKAAAGTSELTDEQKALAGELTTAQEKVDGLKLKLTQVPASKRTEVKAEIAKAEANLRRIKGKIAGIPTKKTVTVDVRFTSSGGIVRAIVKGKLTQIVVNREGGIYQPKPGGIMSVIAEGGVPEAVIPIERSARSYDLLAQTMKQMGVGGGGAVVQNTQMDINFNAPVRTYSETIRAMRDLQRGLV